MHQKEVCRTMEYLCGRETSRCLRTSCSTNLHELSQDLLQTPKIESCISSLGTVLTTVSACNFIQMPQQSKDYIMLFLSSEVFLISDFEEQILQCRLKICVLLPVCEWFPLVQWSCLYGLMAAGSLPTVFLQRKSHQTFCLPDACTPTHPWWQIKGSLWQKIRRGNIFPSLGGQSAVWLTIF